LITQGPTKSLCFLSYGSIAFVHLSRELRNPRAKITINYWIYFQVDCKGNKEDEEGLNPHTILIDLCHTSYRGPTPPTPVYWDRERGVYGSQN